MIVFVVQVWGKYMTIEYLDPEGNPPCDSFWTARAQAVVPPIVIAQLRKCRGAALFRVLGSGQRSVLFQRAGQVWCFPKGS